MMSKKKDWRKTWARLPASTIEIQKWAKPKCRRKSISISTISIPKAEINLYSEGTDIVKRIGSNLISTMPRGMPYLWKRQNKARYTIGRIKAPPIGIRRMTPSRADWASRFDKAWATQAARYLIIAAEVKKSHLAPSKNRTNPVSTKSMSKSVSFWTRIWITTARWRKTHRC